MPRSIASQRTSARERRERGTPSSRGSAQASALTSATTRGGESGLSPPARRLLEPRQSLLVEALAPFPDGVHPDLKAAGDLPVLEPLGRHQDDPGPLHDAVGQRVARRPLAKLALRIR